LSHVEGASLKINLSRLSQDAEKLHSFYLPRFGGEVSKNFSQSGVKIELPKGVNGKMEALHLQLNSILYIAGDSHPCLSFQNFLVKNIEELIR
jgi:hypothetical protein